MPRTPEIERIAQEAAAAAEGQRLFNNANRLNLYRCQSDPAHTLLTITRRLPSLSREAVHAVAELVRSLERIEGRNQAGDAPIPTRRDTAPMTADMLADAIRRQSPRQSRPGIRPA